MSERKVEVVNLRNCNPSWGQPGDIRIDRRSKFGNPFYMRNESERDKVCDQYEQYFIKQEQAGNLNIMELLSAKRLGCWCAPLRCHGDYLKKRIELELDAIEEKLMA